MAVRIEFDLMDVTFLRDTSETQITENKENIQKKENSTETLDDLLLEIYKTKLSRWENIYDKCQKALIRKGWE